MTLCTLLFLFSSSFNKPEPRLHDWNSSETEIKQTKTTYWHHDQRNKSSWKKKNHKPSLSTDSWIHQKQRNLSGKELWYEQSFQQVPVTARRLSEWKSNILLTRLVWLLEDKIRNGQTHFLGWMFSDFAFTARRQMITKFSDLLSILNLAATTFVNRIHAQNHRYTKGYTASIHWPR